MTSEQKEAYQKFKKLKVGALFMEQGSGKTRVAIELAHSTNSDFVLFLCPFSTKDNLITEIQKWQLKIDYDVVGYESLSVSDRLFSNIMNKLKNKTVFIVADESIFIKNDETIRFKRVMELAEQSEYRLILNGTPITKDEWDLYNQMYFLSPKIIGMGRQEFLNTFFTRIQYKKKEQREREFYQLSDINIEYLYKLIEPFIYRVRLQFDKQENEIEHFIPSSIETIEDYNKAKDVLLKSIENEEEFLSDLVNLQYITFTDKERLKHISKHLKGKMIVYCAYVEEAKYLSSLIPSYLITGETNNNDRASILDSFKSNDKPLILTYGVGSYGLNLQHCNRMAFSSLTFDYGKMEQAKYRIKRLGQEKDIEYIYFRSSLGIYNMIENNLKMKINLSETMIEKIKELI